ncbi:MAG: ABC transporter permease [Muribaculaceae bacterium]|nr:ABC transporter permease [Muribaculaceae bacterium]
MNTALVRRLLRRNVSVAQTCGYAFASLVGLSIVLCAIQFYRDASGIFGADGSVSSRDFMVVSKQIGFNDRNTVFTPDEIADLKAQPWVKAVGEFTASRFKAAISLDFAGRGLASETFFESLPAEFFDKLPADWGFDPTDGAEADVPIVLSRDYLSLYNFGFAATRGLPTLRENEIGMIPLTLTLRGRDGQTAVMRGHIAGFSSRINTIAVPEEFMHWANERFAPGSAQEAPSRLVIETDKPGDPAIARYLDNNGLDIAGDKIDNSAAAYMLRLFTGIVLAVGAIISVLAFFILLLSIFLLLQKNRGKLRQLMLLGYSPAEVARPYIHMVVAVNAAILAGGCIVAVLAAGIWRPALATVGAAQTSIWPTVMAGATLMAIVSVLSVVSIRSRVRRDF